MKVATQNEVAADFAKYVQAARTGPVVVTSEGKPVAVLLTSASDADVERLLMGHSEQLQSILEAARQRFREGRGIPHETFWQEVEAEDASHTSKRGRTGNRRRGPA